MQPEKFKCCRWSKKKSKRKKKSAQTERQNKQLLKGFGSKWNCPLPPLCLKPGSACTGGGSQYSHTEMQADTSVSPAALTIHFHKVTGGEADLQDGALGHCAKASPHAALCFRCQGCQGSLTRAFPKAYSSPSLDALSCTCTQAWRYAGGSWSQDAILEIPTDNLKCWAVIDDWNIHSPHWAVNETISPRLLRKTPS